MNLEVAIEELRVANLDSGVNAVTTLKFECNGNWFEKFVYRTYARITYLIDNDAMKRCFKALEINIKGDKVDVPNLGQVHVSSTSAKMYAKQLIAKHTKVTT
jgi:hypothetical protein